MRICGGLGDVDATAAVTAPKLTKSILEHSEYIDSHRTDLINSLLILPAEGTVAVGGIPVVERTLRSRFGDRLFLSG